MLPRILILAIVSTLAITSSVHGVTLPATQDQAAKRDMSSVWLAQAEAQAMVPLKRRNNVVHPGSTAMKSHRDCDDDDDDDDNDDDGDEDDDDDEGGNHGHGHHGDHQGNGQQTHGGNDHHMENGQETNGGQGTADGSHGESERLPALTL